MGRWDWGIYDSDSGLDYFTRITNVLERELNHWCLPENMTNSASWLAQVITVAEVILLFDLHDIGSSVFLQEPQTVLRWQNAFFNIWDGNWKSNSDNYLLYSEPDYRKQHRPGVLALFDHLKGIAEDWEALYRNDSHTQNAPLHPDYPLPYFSLKADTYISGEPFIPMLIEARVQEIIYWLTCQYWTSVDEEALIVAVDVLRFLCETYNQSPIVHAEVVHAWRLSTLDLWGESMDRSWGETHPLYQNIEKSFKRLEAMAKK